MQAPVAATNRSPSFRLRATLALVVVVTGLASVGAYRWASTAAARHVVAMGGVRAPADGLTDDVARIVGEAWPRQRAARTAAPAIPTLQFDLKRKNIGALARKREEALRTGYLIQEEGEWVRADIRVHDGGDLREVRAKIRLKGDFTDHLEGDKWSFRVKVSDGERVLGMQVFSVQHPRVRGYAHEALVLEHMRREGVLAPRYEFVRVVVNGADKGLMALEEHFGKELLEAQQRRESVIVRFDEELKWRTVALMGQTVDFSAPYPLITPFQSSKVEGDGVLARDHDVAVGLLRGLLSKDLRPSQVFDPEVSARFLAVAEVWGAEHALAWNNIRFYFNPITGLLEPIAFDCNLQDAAFRYIPTILVSVYRAIDNLTADWLEDEAMRGPFLRELARISAEYGDPKTWERVRGRERELQAILHQEFPLIDDIGFYWYQQRALRLQRVDEANFRTLPLMPPNYAVLLHAFVVPAAQGSALELYNLVPYPLEIAAVRFTPASIGIDAKLPLVLPPTLGLDAPAPTRLAIASPEDVTQLTAEVTAVIQGYPESRSTIAARPYPAKATAPMLPETDWEAVAAAHPYVVRDGDTARVGPGDVHVRQPLVLPRGVALDIAPGTRLRFSPAAYVLVRGAAVQMRGTAEAGIELLPERDRWPGIAVLDAPSPCEWSHVRVSGTSGLRAGPWQPTGSVMFYRCTVRLRSCVFRDNAAEDMLNLFRCTCDLDGVTVEQCTSDAIDLDFCKGTVRGGLLRDAQGDGLDVSGSTIEVSGTRIADMRDKALSVGERSTMIVTGVEVRDCGTGLASKDDSLATVSGSSFTGIGFVAVIAYTKKAEYGFGRVVASRITIGSAKEAFKAQTGSSIVVDGRTVPPVDFDVDALYREGPMRKDGGPAK